MIIASAQLGGDEMGKLLIKCPKCGNIIGTGFSMDFNSYRSSVLSNNSVNCTYCGNVISWNKEDVLAISFV